MNKRKSPNDLTKDQIKITVTDTFQFINNISNLNSNSCQNIIENLNDNQVNEIQNCTNVEFQIKLVILMGFRVLGQGKLTIEGSPFMYQELIIHLCKFPIPETEAVNLINYATQQICSRNLEKQDRIIECLLYTWLQTNYFCLYDDALMLVNSWDKNFKLNSNLQNSLLLSFKKQQNYLLFSQLKNCFDDDFHSNVLVESIFYHYFPLKKLINKSDYFLNDAYLSKFGHKSIKKEEIKTLFTNKELLLGSLFIQSLTNLNILLSKIKSFATKKSIMENKSIFFKDSFLLNVFWVKKYICLFDEANFIEVAYFMNFLLDIDHKAMYQWLNKNEFYVNHLVFCTLIHQKPNPIQYKLFLWKNIIEIPLMMYFYQSQKNTINNFIHFPTETFKLSGLFITLFVNSIQKLSSNTLISMGENPSGSKIPLNLTLFFPKIFKEIISDEFKIFQKSNKTNVYFLSNVSEMTISSLGCTIESLMKFISLVFILALRYDLHFQKKISCIFLQSLFCQNYNNSLPECYKYAKELDPSFNEDQMVSQEGGLMELQKFYDKFGFSVVEKYNKELSYGKNIVSKSTGTTWNRYITSEFVQQQFSL